VTSHIQIRADIDFANLRRFVREKILEGARERDENEHFPLELLQQLHQLGYFSMIVPKGLGGDEFSLPNMITAAREIAYGSPGITVTMAGNMLAMGAILRFGKPALRDKIAQQVLSRLSLGSFCFTEAHSGSDIMSIKTTGKNVDGGYRISGQKCFITNANYADHFVVMAKLEGARNPKECMAAFYLPRNSEGLSFGKPLKKLGHRDSNTTEVYLDNVFVPSEHLLGTEGGGLQVAVFSLERSRTFLSSSALGVCDRARDLVVEFLGNREHYGKPLLSQPAIRNLLSQLETELQAAWLLTCAAAAQWEAGNYELCASSMAKMYSAQVVGRFTSSAMELFGGWGFSKEFEIERLFRDAKLYEVFEGPTFVQQTIIAKELFPMAGAKIKVAA
jgi:acyl-CoA dehydrogenase